MQATAPKVISGKAKYHSHTISCSIINFSHVLKAVAAQTQKFAKVGTMQKYLCHWGKNHLNRIMIKNVSFKIRTSHKIKIFHINR